MPPNEFQDKETLEYQVRRSAAFQRTFSGPDGELVLKELQAVCFADSYMITKNADHISVIAKAAKRDIWTFIQNEMKYNVENGRKMLNAQAEKR